MSLVTEFKEFAVKGNVVDMAVGFIIGGAFKSIVSSFVDDVVMPPIGMAIGGKNFSQLYLNLSNTQYPSLAEATKAGAPVIKYGAFAQTVIDFLIIAMAIFVMVKVINKLQKLRAEEVKEEAAAEPGEDILLLREIRDSLKK